MTLSSKLSLIIICLSLCSCAGYKKSLVQVNDKGFQANNKNYNYIGANYWQGMNLGAPKSGDQQRLIRELNHLQALGVTNLRVLASSEADAEMKYAVHPALQTAPGVYDEDIWQGLDFLLSEMEKRGMKAVMVLGNFWTWSGGFPQYLKWAGAGKIPYPQEEGTTWSNFSDYSKQFYTNDKAQDMMNNHIKKVIYRKNTITGKVYKKDATIMAWQLANEPRGYDVPIEFVKWTRKTSAYIKSLDKNHLVCLGTEGNTAAKYAGTDVFRDNNDVNIDYITMHIWAQNWEWFEPTDGESVYKEAIEKVNNYWEDHKKVALQLNKPIVLEEFGIARDYSSYNPKETTVWRDKFFDYLFSKVVHSIETNDVVKGLNFWSYSGEGRPNNPGEFWDIGDAILGDPPHERQGWYGVYNTDISTTNIIKRYSDRINN
ncbi:endo-1,4-beta-mannosidase [Formosa agariphila KMM 3901]|uniref:mannan endo-1,4-beta-mannosidase n=1 Tax=Formosa agariphila (strain DSM 15362 / KCTC 12365 / LMG 23005 / KMM 3901 / M-2Alg 35-1) TaxID=1347342 RepID=T2KPY9_FORAG|nr:cellulase family glycosylhydrolase [Formosa agariphila]CDF80795.1 endo-1,4-beta-mannosidase [Formosa agariphila KMM 3901]